MIQHDLVDKIVVEDKGQTSCTEFLCITCPSCKNETVQIATMQDRTFYGHTAPDKSLTWCVVERYKDDIPDPLIYVQRVQGNQENLNISSVPKIW